MATKTIGSGQDYATVAAWCTYIKGLGTLTENEIGELTDNAVYAWGSSTDFSFATPVTFGAYSVTLRAQPGVKHDGSFDSGARIEGLGADYAGLYNGFSSDGEDDLVIEDVEFTCTRTTGGGKGVCVNSYGVTFRRCLGRQMGTHPSTGIWSGLSSSVPFKFEACRAYSNTSNGAGFELKHASTVLHHCTAHNVNTGFTTSAACEAQNCVAMDCDTADWSGTYGTANNNASDDGTHPGTSGVTLTGGDDFELDGYTPSSGSQLDGAGVDVGVTNGADGIGFAATPAIGAYEAEGGGDVTAPVLTNPLDDAVLIGLKGTVTTDEGNGTIYAVATGSTTKPSKAQVKLGQDHTGAAADGSGFVNSTAAATYDVIIGDLTSEVTRYIHFMHEDDVGNQSEVVTSPGETTPVTPSYAEYDGLVILDNSVFMAADGQHQGADNAAALTSEETRSLNDLVTINPPIKARNTSDGSEGEVTANTAGANSVVTATLAGGSDNDWDITPSKDYYELVFDVEGPSADRVYVEGETDIVSEAYSVKFQIYDNSTSSFSEEHTASGTLAGAVDGTYTVTVDVKGRLGFSLQTPSSPSTGPDEFIGDIVIDSENDISKDVIH